MKKIITVLLIGIYCFTCQYGYCLAPETQLHRLATILEQDENGYDEVIAYDEMIRAEEELVKKVEAQRKLEKVRKEIKQIEQLEKEKEDRLIRNLRESMKFGKNIERLRGEGKIEEVNKLIKNHNKYAWFKIAKEPDDNIDMIFRPDFFDNDGLVFNMQIFRYGRDEKQQNITRELLRKAFMPLFLKSVLNTENGQYLENILRVFDENYYIMITANIQGVAEIDRDNGIIKINPYIIRPDCVVFLRYVLIHEILRANYMDESLGEVKLMATEISLLKELDNTYVNNIEELNINLDYLYHEGILQHNIGTNKWDFRDVLSKKPYSEDFTTEANNYIRLAQQA